MGKKWVYLFTEGNADMRELLGGKGANLAVDDIDIEDLIEEVTPESASPASGV